MAALPTVSVIIPAYRAQATLPLVLDALGPQVSDDVEVIVVNSGDSTPQMEHPWARVEALPERTLPGPARNLGARLARGGQLVFLDADAVPAPGWLAALRSAAGDGGVAVAGAVVNGTPDDRVGTAAYLLEFSEFIPRRRGKPRHAASCNLLVERAAFETSGGFAEDLWPGEDTLLTVPWAREGRLIFAQEAVVSHLNRTSVAEMLAHQRRLGRSFAHVCDRVDLPYGGFSRLPWLVVAPVLRLGALSLRLPPRWFLTAARLSPMLIRGLYAWTRGVLAERHQTSDG